MTPETDLPTLDDIRAAAERIAPFVHRTPMLHSRLLDVRAGAEVWFKAENFQKIGAFKARGAVNAIASLTPAEAANGVGTHSSGNHAAAVAMAAARLGIPAYVVMPRNAPTMKKAAVAGYGARISECEPTLAARGETLAAIIAETGAREIHSYDNRHVIAGQGTIGLEIIEQAPTVDAVLVPVGGGGLLGGVACAIKSLRPDIEVIAVEPSGADDALRSFRAGHRIPSVAPKTIADGLLTSVGVRNFALMQRFVDDVITVDDDAIVEAMRLQWTRLKAIVEPSGAVTFAAVLRYPERFAGKRLAAVISGGNVDLDRLPW